MRFKSASGVYPAIEDERGVADCKTQSRTAMRPKTLHSALMLASLIMDHTHDAQRCSDYQFCVHHFTSCNGFELRLL
jgi:hypothetical protein